MAIDDDSVLSDEEMDRVTPAMRPIDIAGVIFAGVPFLLHVNSDSSDSVTTTVDGNTEIVTHSSHTDYVALGGGALAIICAFVGLTMTLRSKRRSRRGLRLAVFAAVFLVGLVQLYRGTH